MCACVDCQPFQGKVKQVSSWCPLIYYLLVLGIDGVNPAKTPAVPLQLVVEGSGTKRGITGKPKQWNGDNGFNDGKQGERFKTSTIKSC